MEKDYWDFSWQEIARYDLLAAYQFVLEKTGRERIYVIGYSIGGTDIMAAMADPEVSDWVQERTAKVLLLGPAIFLSSADSWFGQISSRIWGVVDWTWTRLEGTYNVAPLCLGQEKWAWIFPPLCRNLSWLCEHSLPGGNFSDQSDNIDGLEQYVRYYLSGTSKRMLSHIAQMVNKDWRSPVFTKYDFGYQEN